MRCQDIAAPGPRLQRRVDGTVAISQNAGITHRGVRVQPDFIRRGPGVHRSNEQRPQRIIEWGLRRFLFEQIVICVGGGNGQTAVFLDVNGRKKMPMLVWRFKQGVDNAVSQRQ